MIRTALMLLLLVCGASQLAAAEISRAEAQRLLAGADASTKSTSAPAAPSKRAAPAALEAQCQKLKRQHPDDPRIDYLCGLALLAERRYTQAMPYLQRHLAAEPGDLAAARTQIWTRLQLRQFAPALEECTRLVEQIPQQPGDPDWEETARFAGTVFAYLESARPESGGDSSAKSALRQRVLKQLSGGYLEAFDAGRQAVFDQLSELRERDRLRKGQEQQSREQRKDELAKALEENRTDLVNAEERLQTGGQTLREAQRKFGLAQHQAASLQTDRARIAAQAVAVQARMLELQRSFRDDGRGGFLVSQVDALMMNNLAITLASLNKQLFDIDRQLAALGRDAAQMVEQADQGGRSLAGGQAAIERAEKRSESLKKQTLRLEKQPPRGSGTTSAQQRLLSRYFESPLESERARVLGWFD